MTTAVYGENDRSFNLRFDCVRGTPVQVHYSFLVVLVFQLVASVGYLSLKFTGFIILLYGPILLGSVLLHEFGHTRMVSKFGGEVTTFVLWPLGGFTVNDGTTEGGRPGLKRDFQVAAIGPMTHIPQILGWLVVYMFTSRFDFAYFGSGLSGNLYQLKNYGFDAFVGILAEQAVFLNVTILLMNVFIPAYPLDGGRCLAALLAIGGASIPRIASIMSISSMIIGLGLVFWGVMARIFLESANGIFVAVMSVFIMHSSIHMFRMKRAGTLNEHPLFDRPCYQQAEDTSTADEEAGYGGEKYKAMP